jgi:hypothetical protein
MQGRSCALALLSCNSENKQGASSRAGSAAVLWSSNLDIRRSGKHANRLTPSDRRTRVRVTAYQSGSGGIWSKLLTSFPL